LLFILLVLPKVSAYTAIAIGGEGSPDTELLYSGETLYNIAGSYGMAGRRLYILLRWTFDLIWPMVYGVCLISLSISLTHTIKHRVIKKMYLLPMGAVVFDYLENTFVTIVMLIYPQKLITIGTIASYASLLKWLWLSLAFIGVIVVAMGLLIQRIVRRN